MSLRDHFPETRAAFARFRAACRELRRCWRILRVVKALKRAPFDYWHVKRRQSYAVLGLVKLQASDLSKLSDGSDLVLYVNRDGSMFVRHLDEFTDGRFELLS